MRTVPRGPGVFTLADLDDWPESTLVELHEGCIVVNPPPTGRHALAVNRAIEWLVRAGFERPAIFQGIGVGFEPGDGFIPDVVVMRPRWNPDLLWQPADDVRIVVEVLSPSTSRRDLGHKRDVYLANGITCVIIDPVGDVSRASPRASEQGGSVIVDIAGPDAWIADTPF